ncbi:MAG: endo alpha-1,4 polygalactosaminidase [Thermoleophilia bacterium]|nr:endo alpha-1,4 polygalactosaminidase [Thermoleophilia bacterium]
MLRRLLALAVLLLASVPAGADAAAPNPVRCRGRCWDPPVATSFAWQLQGKLRVRRGVDVFDVDAADTPASFVRGLHRRGRRAVCYLSAGSWERWRADAGSYPDAILGSELEGWPGERWVDIRDPRLRPILAERMAACVRKGFDGIEFDNVDGYSNDSGFDLTAMDQVRFNRWLANAAHLRGLAVGLKNEADQVGALHRWFDFAVVEQCFQYDECDRFAPFVRAGKPVFVAEYTLPLARFCAKARGMRLSAARYPLDLDGRRWACAWPRGRERGGGPPGPADLRGCDRDVGVFERERRAGREGQLRLPLDRRLGRRRSGVVDGVAGVVHACRSLVVEVVTGVVVAAVVGLEQLDLVDDAAAESAPARRDRHDLLRHAEQARRTGDRHADQGLATVRVRELPEPGPRVRGRRVVGAVGELRGIDVEHEHALLILASVRCGGDAAELVGVARRRGRGRAVGGRRVARVGRAGRAGRRGRRGCRRRRGRALSARRVRGVGRIRHDAERRLADVGTGQRVRCDVSRLDRVGRDLRRGHGARLELCGAHAVAAHRGGRDRGRAQRDEEREQRDVVADEVSGGAPGGAECERGHARRSATTVHFPNRRSVSLPRRAFPPRRRSRCCARPRRARRTRGPRRHGSDRRPAPRARA